MIANLYAQHTGFHPGIAKTPAHTLCQIKKNFSGLFLSSNIFCKSRRITNSFCFCPHRSHYIIPDAIGRFPKHSSVAFQMQLQNCRIRLCHITNCSHFQLTKCLYTGSACHEQVFHRKRPHFCLNFFRKKRMHFIWLFKIRRHLSQQLIRGYSYIYGKTKLIAYRIFNLHSTVYRRMKSMCNTGKIHKAFIYTDLFYIWCITPQKIHKPFAVFLIAPVIWRYHYKILTLTKGIRNRFPRTDAISFSRLGLGKHNAMTRLLVTAYNSIDLTQIPVCSILQFFYRAPAQECGVNINMKYYGH